jgi:hypothetical protein
MMAGTWCTVKWAMTADRRLLLSRAFNPQKPTKPTKLDRMWYSKPRITWPPFSHERSYDSCLGFIRWSGKLCLHPQPWLISSLTYHTEPMWPSLIFGSYSRRKRRNTLVCLSPPYPSHRLMSQSLSLRSSEISLNPDSICRLSLTLIIKRHLRSRLDALLRHPPKWEEPMASPDHFIICRNL